MKFFVNHCCVLLILVINKLQIIKLPIKSVFMQKLLMRALFADFSMMHNDDLVCMLDGGETMGHHDGSAAFHEAL